MINALNTHAAVNQITLRSAVSALKKLHAANVLKALVTLNALLMLNLVLASPASAEFVDGNHITILDGDTVALPCASPSPGC